MERELPDVGESPRHEDLSCGCRFALSSAPGGSGAVPLRLVGLEPAECHEVERFQESWLVSDECTAWVVHACAFPRPLTSNISEHHRTFMNSESRSELLGNARLILKFAHSWSTYVRASACRNEWGSG